MIEEPRQSGLIRVSVETPEPLGAGINFSDPNSPLAPFYLRSVHLIALAFLGFVIFVPATLFPLWHTDVWGHMRYGQWMVEHKTIPTSEPFCPWWDGRVPFTQYYTLTQLIMYGAYAAGERLAGGDELRQMAGGVEFLRLLHALLTTARFAVLLAVFVRVSRSWPVALFGVVAVAFLDLSNLAVFRPQTFAQVGFAILLWPLSRPVLSRRAILLVPALLAVWANGHGSYVVGFALLGAVFLGRVIALATSRPWVWPWYDSHAVRIAATGLLAFVAVGLLNPYGFTLFARTVAMSSHPTLLAAVGEWQPLAFVWEKGWHWVFMISLVVLGMTQLVCRRPMPPHHLVVLLMFGIGVALQNRFVIWWAMVLPWVLVPLWADLAKDWPARLTPTPSTPSFRKTAIGLAVLFAIFMWSGPSRWVIQGYPCPVEEAVSAGTPWELAREVTQPGAGTSDWAHEISDIIQKNYPNGAYTGTIMATPMQGDYLMWALAPKKVPVTYAHMHLFHPDYWEELGIVGRGEPGWQDILEKYQVNLLVVEADFAPKLRDHLMQASNEWKIVLDESGDTIHKHETLTRQLIAIRITPLLLPPRSS
jgi:hypothetical protein